MLCYKLQDLHFKFIFSVNLVGIANKHSTGVSKTKFNHHLSGSFTGILNFKVRVQYERQLGNQSGSNKGFFGQAKLYI